MTRDEVDPVSLEAAVSHLLEECRMVLPGLQALFGFQLIAVFSAGFEVQLSPFEQRLHLLALGLFGRHVLRRAGHRAALRQTQ